MQRMNIQATLRAYLEHKLDGVTVRVSVPDPRPDYLVVVRRIGGSMQDGLIDVPSIELLMYAPTEAKAADLAAKCAQAIFDLQYADGYASVDETYFYSDYDVTAKNPRWYAQYQIKTYLSKE